MNNDKDNTLESEKSNKPSRNRRLGSRSKLIKFLILLTLIAAIVTGFILISDNNKDKVDDINEDAFGDSLREAQEANESKNYQVAASRALDALNASKSTDNRVEAFGEYRKAAGELSDYKAILEQAKLVYDKSSEEDTRYPYVLDNLASAHYGMFEVSSAVEVQERLVSLYGAGAKALYMYPYIQEVAVGLLTEYKTYLQTHGDGQKSSSFDYLLDEGGAQ